jgi:nitrous oxidase accessory protein NosD
MEGKIHLIDHVIYGLLGLVLVSILVIMVTAVSAGKPPESACPPPTVSKGGVCTLAKDTVLTSTIELPSNTILDCKGKKLTPSVAGITDNPLTAENEFQPSQPELAVFLNQAHGAKVQNCNIKGFDFGIYLFNSTAVNEISNNQLNVRTNGVMIVQSDNQLVRNNVVRYASERGHGIMTDFDNDANRIIGNNVTGSGTGGFGFVNQHPGGVSGYTFGGQDFPHYNIGIFTNGGTLDLLNLVVNGKLYQLPFEGNEHFSTNTEIRGNKISILTVSPGTCTLDPATACTAHSQCAGKGACYFTNEYMGIGLFFGSRDTQVIGNAVTGGSNGLRTGGHTNLVVVPPGTCSLDSTRLCVNDDNCFIPAVDEVSKGDCKGVSGGVARDYEIHNTMYENNTVSGFADVGLRLQGPDETAKGNAINCGGISGTVGVSLFTEAIESGAIERNSVTGCEAGLDIDLAGSRAYPVQPKRFAAEISLNNFYNNTENIRASSNYPWKSELSVNGRGNYWGHTCENDSANDLGFIEAGKPDADSNDADVIDSHPYGEPVAGTPDGSLPPTCQ